MRGLGLCLVALAACSGEDVAPDPGAADAAPCEVEPLRAAVERAVAGAAAGYPADGALRGQADALARDKDLRRAAAWRTVEKVFATTRLAGVDGELPRFQAWYDRGDLVRGFGALFLDLDGAERRSHRRFTDDALDRAFPRESDASDEAWSAQRVAAFTAALADAEPAVGTGGIARVSYSPAAARHLVRGYPELLQCLRTGAPGRFVDGPPAAHRELRRDAVALGACAVHRAGPFFVASGETLDVAFDGAELVVRGGDGEVCRARDRCTAAGPGAFEIEVRGPAAGTLTVAYAAPDGPWSACLPGAFPGDAVIVKADWRRVLPGTTVPVHDTSARALPRATWDAPIAQANPGPDQIYTLRLPATDHAYRLTALHIMTKELDHWLWITLWWSPTPNDDFGADRPPSLGGVLANYKMCVVTDFAERDPRPDGGIAGDLGAALAATHDDESWCSNPFLEAGQGNAATSCVGCHQHAGSNVRSEDVLSDPVRFPAHGRTQVRNNFPTDYTFAAGHGDDLTRAFADVVEYWTR
jgi:hypothetical protein